MGKLAPHLHFWKTKMLSASGGFVILWPGALSWTLLGAYCSRSMLAMSSPLVWQSLRLWVWTWNCNKTFMTASRQQDTKLVLCYSCTYAVCKLMHLNWLHFYFHLGLLDGRMLVVNTIQYISVSKCSLMYEWLLLVWSWTLLYDHVLPA